MFVEVTLSGQTLFRENVNSAVDLRDSTLQVAGHLNFTGNVAQVGGAMYMFDSKIVLHNGTRMLFGENVAISLGGAIFSHMDFG